MSKIIKGSVAAAAGTVLLLGGAGTFMSWNSEAAVNGGSVASGHLRLNPQEEPAAWTVNEQQVSDIASFQVVPGDIVEYTTQLDLEAEGENLNATLTLTGGAITPATPGRTADEALVAVLEDTAKLELSTASKQITEEPDGSYNIDAGGGSIKEDVDVSVTLTFPFIADSATHPMNDAMDGSVNLSNMSVSLVQNA